MDPPRSMAGTARGELEGRGHWRLFEQDGVTAVVYDWQVATTKRWMNLLAPLARPVFDYNHDVVMGWGGEGLARRLGARLLRWLIPGAALTRSLIGLRSSPRASRRSALRGQ